jgi:hypothetical protein
MGFPLSFFFIIELNKKKLQILLQDKYNIGVLMVNIEFMWLSKKRMERFARAHHFLVHKMLDFRSFRPLDPLRPALSLIF